MLESRQSTSASMSSRKKSLKVAVELSAPTPLAKDVRLGSRMSPFAHVAESKLAEDVREMMKMSGFQSMLERDADVLRTPHDRIAYTLENILTIYPNGQFFFIAVFTGLLIGLLGWWEKEAHRRSETPVTLATATYTAFQVVAAGGQDLSITGTEHRAIFFVMILSGLVVFAILVGFITEAVQEYMLALSSGRSKVVEKGHTLILGWNESTPRLVCQIAFLRRAWRVQNERWDRRWFPWRRVPPSTPVAKARVIIMCDTLAKRLLLTRARPCNSASSSRARDMSAPWTFTSRRQ